MGPTATGSDHFDRGRRPRGARRHSGLNIGPRSRDKGFPALGGCGGHGFLGIMESLRTSKTPLFWSCRTRDGFSDSTQGSDMWLSGMVGYDSPDQQLISPN